MDIFIYGTGGHAKVIFDIATAIKTYDVVCFVDDTSDIKTFLDKPVLKTAEVIKLTKMGVIAIGANHIREKVSKEVTSINSNVNFISLVHPTAIISENVTIGSGTVIMPGAIVNSGTVIEDHCVVNTGVIVEHDCILRNFSSLAPGAIMGGGASVGARSFIGLDSKLKHGVNIGEDTVIGMGSVVTQNVISNKLAFGVPCKEKSNRDKADQYL